MTDAGMESTEALRILFVTTVNPYSGRPHGGAERSMRLIAQRLARHGHDVAYLCRGVDPADRKRAAAEGVRLHALAGRGPNRGRLGGVRRAVRTFQARRLFARHGTDLAYCFYEPDILSVLVAARGRRKGPKLVMRMAGLGWADALARDPGRTQDYMALFSAVDAVNYLEPRMEAAVAGRLRDLNLATPFRRGFVADIGAEPLERTIPYDALPRDRFDLVMPARFSPGQKRQDILVRAMALLPADLPARLTLVGAGGGRSEIVRLIDDLGIANRVAIVDFEPQAALWSRMEHSHLLCLATNHEGLSKAVLEAFSIGLPVLASDVTPLSHQIEEGVTGFLSANTPEAWAARITELARDPDARIRVARAALSAARDLHDPDRNIARFESAFRDILDRPGPRVTRS